MLEISKSYCWRASSREIVSFIWYFVLGDRVVGGGLWDDCLEDFCWWD